MPRKHLIASATNKKQQNQAKIWQKLSREIKAAVKIGGSNIDANPRLKAAIEKAVRNNLSRDSINKNINGKEDAGELLNLEFECYGPQGVQIIVGALTDNTNRTISSLNGYLAKLHGEIAKTNSVKIYFEKVGLILLSKTNNLTLDNIMEITMEYEIIDLIDEEECFVIKTSPDDFYKVKDVLAKNNLNIIEAEIKMLPLSPISSLNDDTKTRLDTFLNACEEDEDIQWTVTNFEGE